MVPFDCDALLPIEQRFASTKFRRMSRALDFRRMDWGEAVELVAWVKFLGGPNYARGVMHWSRADTIKVQALIDDPDLAEAAAPLVAENEAQVTIEDGFKLLTAINQSPKRRTPIPRLVKMALDQERHDLKLTAKQQAEKHGLSVDQVLYRRKRGRVEAVDRSLVGLAFG